MLRAPSQVGSRLSSPRCARLSHPLGSHGSCHCFSPSSQVPWVTLLTSERVHFLPPPHSFLSLGCSHKAFPGTPPPTLA